MKVHHNSNNAQLHLNLKQFKSPVANGLTTRQVSNLLEIVAKEKVSSKEIRDRSSNGRFEVCYKCGVLIIFPSQNEKLGKFWRWDVVFSPVSLASSSV